MLARLKRSGCKPQGDRESHRWCRGIHHFKRVSFGLHYIAPRKAFARALCRMHARFCRVCAGAHATVGENPKYALPINIGGSGPATCSADAGSYDFDLECLVWNYHMRVWMNEKLCVCIYICIYHIYICPYQYCLHDRRFWPFRIRSARGLCRCRSSNKLSAKVQNLCRIQIKIVQFARNMGVSENRGP